VTVQNRVYVALNRTALRRLATAGRLEPAPFTAYAVTTDLRREHPNADDEELEYLAFIDAATDAATAAPTGGSARVVAAADVDADLLTDLLVPGAPVSAVRVAAPVPRRQVASFHVADEGAGFAWYDATELDVVIDLLG
jgi:hypothetical protein